MTNPPLAFLSPYYNPIEKLSKAHDLGAFNSGRASSDEWLKKYALPNQASDSASVYVVTKGVRVAGYYSLTSSSVRTDESTVRVAKGQPKKGAVPVILIGQLAVDQSEQGKGLGKALLKDAILRCEQSAEIVAARAVLVHAVDQTARLFYEQFDFESCPADELTMMLLMKDIREALKA